jgi:hypothetical protein
MRSVRGAGHLERSGLGRALWTVQRETRIVYQESLNSIEEHERGNQDHHCDHRTDHDLTSGNRTRRRRSCAAAESR